MGRNRQKNLTASVCRFDSINRSLFRLFSIFNADFALIQFRGAVLTTEITTAAAACHEGHPDSIFGFASITLAGTTGFGHRSVSAIGRLRSWGVNPFVRRLLREMSRVRHTAHSTLISHRYVPLQFKTDLRRTYESGFLFDGDVSPF